MRTITAVSPRNTLCAILDHVSHPPHLDPDLPGPLEFKANLIKRIQELQREDYLHIAGTGCEAA